MASKSQSERSRIASSPSCTKSPSKVRHLLFFKPVDEEQTVKLGAQVD